MITKRVIPCLDVKEGKVVKSYSMVTSPDGTKLVSMIDKLLSE